MRAAQARASVEVAKEVNNDKSLKSRDKERLLKEKQANQTKVNWLDFWFFLNESQVGELFEANLESHLSTYITYIFNNNILTLWCQLEDMFN